MSVGVAMLLVGNGDAGAVLSTDAAVGVAMLLVGNGDAGAVLSTDAAVGVGIVLSGIGVSAGAVMSTGTSVGVAVLLGGIAVVSVVGVGQPPTRHGVGVEVGVRGAPATSSIGPAGSE